MRANFVTIHGIDGTGKSTIANQLAELLNAQGHLAVFYDNLVKEIGDLPNTGGGLFDGKIQQSGIISRALADGQTVSRDRWLIDIFASETFKGEQLSLVPKEILRPDLSVILLCEESVRQSRIRLRSNPTIDDLTPKVEGTRPDYFEKYLLKHIANFAACSLVLDTTHNDPKQATAKIIAELEKGEK